MDSFEDFLGNERIVSTLRQSLEKRRVPHSMLFAGSDGVGKRTLAIRLAKVLNCLEIEGGFCNRCVSCKKIEAGTHPDILYVSVLEDKQFLHIDQIREARADVFYQPFEGRCRVILFDDSERMKEEAANSILKILEEPPPSTKIILLTKKFHSLLPTIRSRCQIFSFSPVPLPLIRKFLEDHTDLAPANRELTARLAQGSIGRALRIDLDAFHTLRAEVLELISASITRHSAETIMALSESIGKNREQFEERLNILYLLFQDILYLLHDAPEEWISNIDLVPQLQNLAKSISPESLHGIFAGLDAIRGGLRVNINRPIALENFSFSLAVLTRPNSLPSRS